MTFLGDRVSPSPTTQELLKSPFFKASKKKSYLVGAILSVSHLLVFLQLLNIVLRIEDLPPLSERQERRLAHQAQTLHSVDSWDFTTTLNPSTPNVYPSTREEVGPLFQGGNIELGDGIFEMEDDPAHEKERREQRHGKCVYWADESKMESQPNDPPEMDLPSSSDPSDSDCADPGLSPSTSPADGSSPPSSFSDSTTVPRLQSPKNHMPTNDHRPSETNPQSFRMFPTSKPSSDQRRLSSSSSQVGLWKKFKTNVRGSPTRDSLQGKPKKEDE